MFTPATLLQLNANVNIKFDNFKQVEEHELAQPALLTFNELLEFGIGCPWEEFMGL